MNERKIAILHLDLGIGGAEQLIVSIAKSIQKIGHSVTIWTTHHDPNHCFEETKPDGCLGSCLRVFGDWIPRQVAGYFTALMAIIRMIYLTLVMISFRSQYDLVIVDGVSVPIFLLKLFGYRVLFYCHFPDLLLCTDRRNKIKQLYRTIVDKLEEVTTSSADRILVNSHFTLNVFAGVFPQIHKTRKPMVLYPVVPKSLEFDYECYRKLHMPYTEGYSSIFVSINRYERKKKIEIAIHALHSLLTMDTSKLLQPITLVIAGGYDSRVEENVNYFEELCRICEELRLPYYHYEQERKDIIDFTKFRVIFRRSIPSMERSVLFQISRALIYTPDREHFGIVPIEAMSSGLPVIACNSGGPLETVVQNKTGFLCNQDPQEFAEKMFILSDRSLSQEYAKMKKAAVDLVEMKFSEEAMTAALDKHITEILNPN